METSIGKLDQTVICSRTALNIIIFLDEILENVKDMSNCGEVMNKRKDLEVVLRKGLKIKEGEERPDLNWILSERDKQIKKRYEGENNEH